MRQRHPSKAAQGCLKCGARCVVRGMATARPSDFRRVASSPGCSLTSAKMTPLQHSPHFRQMLSSGRSFGLASLFKVPKVRSSAARGNCRKIVGRHVAWGVTRFRCASGCGQAKVCEVAYMHTEETVEH